MQPAVRLNIPQPCHEDWHKMTPSQQGRFCSACAKEVVDFTAMSDNELLEYFLQKKDEKVCGRMYPDQLSRPVTKIIWPKKKKWWYWQYAAMFLLFLSKTGSAKAQGTIKVISTQKKATQKQAVHTEVQGNIMPATGIKNRVAGTITDEQGLPVAGAGIIVKGAASGTITDAAGNYQLKTVNENDVLVISAIGFERKEITVKNNKPGSIILTTLKMQTLGEVVISGGIAADYDYTPAPDPKHVAVIEVRDNATHQPVKAHVVITKNNTGNTETAITSSKGVYRIRGIKEQDVYSLTIKAAGYLETTVEINSSSFNKRKETKYVFLERRPVITDYKKMDEVMVAAYGSSTHGCPRYVTGAVSYVRADTVFTVKKVIQDTFNSFVSRKNAISIAPNPVIRGSAVTVSFTVKQTGSCLLQITNAAGQLIQQQQVIAAGKNNTAVIHTNALWSSGLYYLRISGTKNNLLSTNSFIVQ